MQHWFGGGWPEAIALMSMHIAVWSICVTILPTFSVSNEPKSHEGHNPSTHFYDTTPARTAAITLAA
jgi:hypothetical protein